MSENTTSYTVEYSLDESGWWQARIVEVPGCHTQARTIRGAYSRIREALQLFVDDADTADIKSLSTAPRYRRAM